MAVWFLTGQTCTLGRPAGRGVLAECVDPDVAQLKPGVLELQ